MMKIFLFQSAKKVTQTYEPTWKLYSATKIKRAIDS